jgi:NADH-quinone oxidoreductase subunit C
MIWNRQQIRAYFSRRKLNDDRLRARWIEQSLARCQKMAAKPHSFNIARGATDPPSVAMETLEQIKNRAEAGVPGATIDILPNPGPSQQSSLLLDNEHAVAVVKFLRDDPALRLDFCSNATGVDWLDRTVKKKMKVKKIVEEEEKEVEEVEEEFFPGYLEAVYHLYSMAHKHGPVIIRTRTADRAEGARLPSLTPIYRSAEFQEREIFDLYGVRFDGHPDLRRILMWDEFEDFPMRKDYREPDDYEYEPTPHDDVLEKAKQHYAARPQLDGAENITAQQ